MLCAIALQVLRAGDWTEQLMSGLTKLGCCLLDTHIINFPCKALAAFVQEPTAAGLLDALAAAQAVSAAGQAQLLASQQGRGGAGAGAVSVQARWQQQLQQLSGAERHHLRTYLLQGKWFAAGSTASTSSGDGSATGFTQQQLQVLRSLPIFEVHPPLPYEDSGSGSNQELQQRQQQQQDVGLLGLLQAPGPASSYSAPVAGAGSGPYPQGQYRSLSPTGSQQQQQVLLPPQGITNGQVLGSQFLKCESESEEAVLVKHLGVPRLSMQEFLMLHLAKAPQQLDPRALVSTMTYILCMLKQLSVDEPDLPLTLKVLPVIPTRAGVVQQAAAAAPGLSQGAGQVPSQGFGAPSMQQAQQLRQQLVLAPPCELFDPSNAVLVQLLEPRHFPAAPFDGSVESRAGGGGAAAAAEAKALLEGLTLCGLRTKLDLEVRLLCWVA